MKNNAKRKQEALDAFIGHKARIDEILSRLQEASDDHFGGNPDEINWSDAGFLSDIADSLQQVNDRVFNEGEYAPANKT